jgi:transcriptional regulator with XRE-family HTH domain
MQAFFLPAKTMVYGSDMRTGRPPQKERTPFGQRVYAARMAIGLSQLQVGEALGIKQPAFAAWERDPIALRPEQLAQLAVVLKVSVDELVGHEAPRKAMAGPTGKARKVFDQVSRLPRAQQQKIVEMAEAFIALQTSNERKAAASS